LAHLFVDESGETGLSGNSRRYFVYGFVYCENPSSLRINLSNYLIRCHKTNRYPHKLRELKFNLPRTTLIKRGYSEENILIYNSFLSKIRQDICAIIALYSDGIFVSIIDKTTIIQKTWQPETLGNYVFAHSIHENILSKLALNDIIIHYDSGRLAQLNQDDFDKYVTIRAPTIVSTRILEIKGLSSLSEPCLWAADFLAGSFYRKFALGDALCADRILDTCNRIGNGLRIFWR
jgi:Protein of unknown function (DUF3800)